MKTHVSNKIKVSGLKSSNIVTPSMKVCVLDLSNGKQEWYSFSNQDGCIFVSKDSPVGKSLLRKTIGETIKVKVLAGDLIFKIIDIKETKKPASGLFG